MISSSNIYYEIIYDELFSGFLNKYTEIVFWIIIIILDNCLMIV